MNDRSKWPINPEPISVTIQGAIGMTGLGMTTIYKLISEGELETVKIGRRTLVKVRSIKKLLGEGA